MNFASFGSRVYLTRSQTRAWALDYPIGDPFGGTAYGERNDPATATMALVGSNIVGGLMGADAAKDAGRMQSEAADRATQLQREMFDVTRKDLAPWMEQGKIALGELSRLTGRANAGGLTPGDVTQLYRSYFGRDPSPQEIDWQLRNTPSAADLEEGIRTNPEFTARGVQAPTTMYGRNAPGGTNLGAGALLKPFSLQDFQESPAFQFNLDQGRKAIEKSAAARKTFYAPATLQDIAKFSQGLASNEFQNAYSNYNTNMGNIWNRLYAMSGSGQNAAAQTGAFGSAAGRSMGDTILSGGAASAAGRVGAANAISGGITGAGNTYLMNQILSQNQTPSVSLRSLPDLTGANDLYGFA